MDDLIERLRARLSAEKAVRETGHNAADREHAELIRLLTKASYALEVARAENKGHRIAIQQLYDRAERLGEALREARQMIRDLLPDATFTKWDALLRDQGADSGENDG